MLAGVLVGDDGEPDRSLDKGRKIYSLCGPTPTLTSPNIFHFIGNRSVDPNLVGVRQLEFVEILEISGFNYDLSTTAYLHSRSEEDALKGVAAAVRVRNFAAKGITAIKSLPMLRCIKFSVQIFHIGCRLGYL